MRNESKFERLNTPLNRALSLIVTLAMVLSLMPAQGVAWAVEEYGQAVSAEEESSGTEGSESGGAAESSDAVETADAAETVADVAPAQDNADAQAAQEPQAIEVVESAEATDPAPADSQASQQEVAATEAATQPAQEAAESADPAPADEQNTQDTYVYEDDSVKVTATVADPASLPKGVELRVTPVTSGSSQYNYGAYMDALNNSSEETYDANNTLLYDVAFLVTKDGKVEEVQPANGSVKVNFEFKNDQLKKELDAPSADDVDVIHLPLKAGVKDASDTTASATSISASDVVVEQLADADVSGAGSNQLEIQASNFSVFALKYTVDFTYDGFTYSIAGESSILLSELFQTLGIDKDVAFVRSVEFSDPSLVKVEQTDGNWKLTSLKAFSTEETLTITMASGETFVVKVTDEQANVTITFYKVDGTTVDTSVSLDAKYYIAVGNGNSINAVSKIEPSNGVANLALGDISKEVTLVKYIGEDELTADYASAAWYYDKQQKMFQAKNFGSYTFEKVSESVGTISYKAVKLPAYEVEIIFPDGMASSIGDGYSVYAAVQADSQKKQGATYYDMQNVILNGMESKTLSFSAFNRGNDIPDTHTYKADDEVTVVLGKNLDIETNDGQSVDRGAIKGGERIEDGDVLDGFLVSVTTSEGKTTYTFTKPDPYKYKIEESNNSNISFDSAYQNNWYLLSTLTKQGGGTYYYVTPVELQGKSVVPATDANNIAAYYTADNDHIGQITIGQESSNNYNSGNTKMSVYQNGDTVVNQLIHVSKPASNYNDIVNGNNNGRESFGNGSAANKYTVTTSENNGVGTIKLTPVPNLKIKTVFNDTTGHEITGNLPTDYKLLVKMVRDGETYYALQAVDATSNPSSESAPVVFYKYMESDGNGSLDSTNPYYYSGVEGETISTQVVTGAETLTADLIQHKVSEAVFYNENTIGGTQKSDLTRDLYSTSSSIDKSNAETHVMTTEFVKQNDNGVPHDIKVSYYKKHASNVSEGELNPNDNNMSTEEGAYFFRVRLYNNDKLVAYKIIPVTAQEASQANSTGTFTHTIGADETFQLVDDKGVDIPNGTLHYDPTVYTSNVRLYKANSANDLPNNLSEVSDKGSDTIDGYDFWQNVYSETKNGESITKTNTDLSLYSAYKKKYQVKIVIDDGANPKTEDDIRLNVEAAHKTTNVDRFIVEDIANGEAYRSNEAEDGKTVITYLIEDQTFSPIAQHWNPKGSDSNTLTGNETFSLSLQQGANGKQSEGYPVNIDGKPYNVTYDTGSAADKNIVMDDNGRVTTITHYVYLTKANYDSALTPEDVLGDAYEFGIVADTYKQDGHTETNFAVNHYDKSDNFDIEGSKGPYSDVPFYIGEIVKEFKVGSGTNADLYVYTPQSEIDKNVITQSNTGKTKDKVVVTATPREEINAYVNGMIDDVRQTSATMAQKATIKPATVTQGKPNIDTRSLPDGITIYVDCSNIVDKIAEGNEWEIHKKDGQTIVLNIPSSGHVQIGKFKVWTDKYGHDSSDGIESTTNATDRDTEHNMKVDEVIFEHVYFNMPNATSVNTDNASAMFLAPNASTFTQSNGAGWIVCGGTVDSKSEWHFYRHNRHFSSTVGSLQINKRLNSDAPGEAKNKTYKFYIREKQSDNTYLYYFNNPDKPVEGVPYNPVITSSNPVELTITGASSYKLNKIGFNTDAEGKVIPKQLEVVELEDGREISGYTLVVKNEPSDAATVTGGRTTFVNVTNTYTPSDTPSETGSLKVKKSVSGAELTAAEKGAITFTVTGSGHSYTMAYSDAKFANGEWVISELPIGQYTVTESAGNKSGYTLSTTYKVDTAAAVNGKSATVTVSKDATTTVAFTNTYTAPSPTAGSLKITKNVTVNGMETTGTQADGTYIFEVHKGEAATGAKVGDNITLTVNNGSSTSTTVNDLEAGKYTIVEVAGGTGKATQSVPANQVPITVEVAAGTTATNAIEASFTNNIDLGSLEITKSFAGASALSDTEKNAIKFTVTGPNNYKVEKTYNEFTNGKLTLTDLPLGAYTVAEENAGKTGYNLTTTYKVNDANATAATAAVTKGGTAKIELINTYADATAYAGEVTFSATKLLKDSGNKIKTLSANQFEFELKDGSGAVLQTKKNGADGNVSFDKINYSESNLGNGGKATFTYTISEKLPNDDDSVTAGIQNAGVTYDQTVYTVVVDLEKVTGNTDLVKSVTYYKGTGNNKSTLENGKVPEFQNTYAAKGTVKLKIKKAVSGTEWPKDNGMNKPVTFTLSGTGGTLPATKTVNVSDTSEHEFDEITYTLADAGKTYTYKIAETTGFGGSNWTVSPSEVTATVTVGTDQGNGTLSAATVTYSSENYTITNTYSETPAAPKIKVSKVDIHGGAEIADATIQIIKKVNETESIVEEWASTTTPHEVTAALEKGVQYILRETVAPNGYAITTDTTFQLDNDGKVDKNNTTTNVRESDDVLLVEDTQVFLNKTSITGDEELGGALIQIKDSTGKIVDSWTSKKGEVHAISGIKVGEEYTLHEETAPNGYKTVADTKFTVGKDGKVTGGVATTTDAKGNTIILVKDELTAVKVSKTDITGANEIANAKLQVLGSDGKVVVLHGEKLEWTSATDGGHEIKGLSAGTYTLHEETAPNGYALAADTTFTIEADGTVKSGTTTVADGRILVKDAETATISKRDITGDAELIGAKIQVKDSDNKIIDEWTSEIGGGHKVKNVRMGVRYTIHEEVAPDGYSIATDTYFTIGNDGKLTVEGTETKDINGKTVILIKDARTSVKISKKAVGGEDELAGAKIQVRDSEGNVVVLNKGTDAEERLEWTSGAEPKVIEGLKAGVEYTLHEEAAPDGYTVASDIKFTIDESGKVTSGNKEVAGGHLVINDALTKIAVSKVDVTDQKEIAGAHIQILKDGKVVKVNGKDVEWTSVADDASTTDVDEGIHYVEGLKTGETYTLRETVAPDGYAIATDTTFTLKADGSIDTDKTKTTTNTKDGVLLVEDSKIQPTEHTVSVTKEVEQKVTWAGDEAFEFTIKRDEGNDKTTETLPTGSIKIKNGETANFAITFKDPGTYYYQINEVMPAVDKKTTYMYYDTATKYAKVVVTSNAKENKFDAVVTYGTSKESCTESKLTIKNVYATPALEKYINKDVHQDLPAFDTPFVYDILAYVTKDARRVVIHDALQAQDGISFDCAEADVVVTDLGTENDHTAHGTVEKVPYEQRNTLKNMNRLASTRGAKPTISGKNLEIDLPDVANAEMESGDTVNLQGHWVRVTYNVRLDNSKVADMQDYGKNDDIVYDNKTVISSAYPNGSEKDSKKSHDGVATTANYEVYVEGEGGKWVAPEEYKLQANVITVTPPTKTFEVKKVWKAADGKDLAWPEGAKVKVDLLADGKVVTEDLAKDLGITKTSIELSADKTSDTFGELPIYDKYPYSIAESSVTGVDNVFVTTVSGDVNAGFTVTNAKAGIKISKVDVTNGGKELAGAHIQILDQAGNVVEAGGKKLEWVSTNEPQVIAGLETGVTYTLHETIAPEEYLLSTDTTFSLNADGTINSKGTTTTVKDGILIVQDARPALEKYINKDVHQDLPAFDTPFVYDILAYVPKNAKRIVIGDNLVEGVSFNTEAKDVLVQAIGPKNDHTAHGTVEKAEGTTIDTAKVTVDKQNKKLIVEIPDNAGSYVENKDTDSGYWVRVTYNVKLDNSVVSHMKNYEDNDKDVVDNKTVISSQYPNGTQDSPSHDGVKTGAYYDVYLAESAREEDLQKTWSLESNEITVTPPTETVQVAKAWKDANGNAAAWPEGAKATVSLLVNGKEVDDETAKTLNISKKSVELTAANPSDVFGELPIYDAYDYSVAETSVTGVDKGFVATVSGSAKDGFVVTNTTTKVSISKVDIAGGAELEGAHIQILDKYGNVVEEWDSTKEAHVVEGLKPGEKYTLRETVAPLGYAIATDTTFVLNADGTLDKSQSTVAVSDGGTLLVEDAAIAVYVSKVDIADGEEISGAKLQVLDANGKVIDEWTSKEGENHLIKGLVAGQTYTLRETIAPDGYNVTTDIEFTVNADGTITTKGKTTKDANGNTVLLVEDAKKAVKKSAEKTPGKTSGKAATPATSTKTSAFGRSLAKTGDALLGVAVPYLTALGSTLTLVGTLHKRRRRK